MNENDNSVRASGPKHNKTMTGAVLQIIFMRAQKSLDWFTCVSEMTSAFCFQTHKHHGANGEQRMANGDNMKRAIRRFCNVMLPSDVTRNSLLRPLDSSGSSVDRNMSGSLLVSSLHLRVHISLIRNRFVHRRNKWLVPAMAEQQRCDSTLEDLILHATQVGRSSHHLFSAKCVNGECEQMQQNDAIKSCKQQTIC